jgi:AraC-like DNA-binding protein
MYIDKGRHSVELDGVIYELNEGEMILIPPKSFHNMTAVSDAYIAYISFETHSARIGELYSKPIALNAYQKELLSSVIRDCEVIFTKVPKELGVCGKMPDKNIEGYRLQAVKNKIELILIDVYRIKDEEKARTSGINVEKHKEREFYEVVDYLKLHLSENLTLDGISAGTGMSVSKIKRLFNEYGEASPSAYFNEMKIKEAKRLIRSTSMNFTQIAESLGFDSVHYFSKAFKKQTNMTPSEYAKTVYTK